MGPAGERFDAALRVEGYTAIERADDLEAAVARGYAMAEGKPVLLSPACASFDRYRDFMQRGVAFKEAVMALKTREEHAAHAQEKVGS